MGVHTPTWNSNIGRILQVGSGIVGVELHALGLMCMHIWVCLGYNESCATPRKFFLKSFATTYTKRALNEPYNNKDRNVLPP